MDTPGLLFLAKMEDSNKRGEVKVTHAVVLTFSNHSERWHGSARKAKSLGEVLNCFIEMKVLRN